MSLALDETAITDVIKTQFMSQIRTTVAIMDKYNHNYCGIMSGGTNYPIDAGTPFTNDPRLNVLEKVRCEYCGHSTLHNECHFCGGPQ